MKVTVIGKNDVMKLYEKYEDVDYDLVTIKEIHKRNGYVCVEVRIKRGNRDIVLSNGNYHTLTVQDEETGRYLVRVER